MRNALAIIKNGLRLPNRHALATPLARLPQSHRDNFGKNGKHTCLLDILSGFGNRSHASGPWWFVYPGNFL